MNCISGRSNERKLALATIDWYFFFLSSPSDFSPSGVTGSSNMPGVTTSLQSLSPNCLMISSACLGSASYCIPEGV
eukprot:8625867-Karenia_brevis.AAC.1